MPGAAQSLLPQTTDDDNRPSGTWMSSDGSNGGGSGRIGRCRAGYRYRKRQSGGPSGADFRQSICRGQPHWADSRLASTWCCCRRWTAYWSALMPQFVVMGTIQLRYECRTCFVWKPYMPIYENATTAITSNRATRTLSIPYGMDNGRWMLSTACDGRTLLRTRDGQRTKDGQTSATNTYQAVKAGHQ